MKFALTLIIICLGLVACGPKKEPAPTQADLRELANELLIVAISKSTSAGRHEKIRSDLRHESHAGKVKLLSDDLDEAKSQIEKHEAEMDALIADYRSKYSAYCDANPTQAAPPYHARSIVRYLEDLTKFEVDSADMEWEEKANKRQQWHSLTLDQVYEKYHDQNDELLGQYE